MTEINFNPHILRDFCSSDYDCKETGRRFNLVSGQYVEQAIDTTEYTYAVFGEYEMSYARSGKHRVQKVTIIYSRLMSLDEEKKCPKCGNQLE